MLRYSEVLEIKDKGLRARFDRVSLLRNATFNMKLPLSVHIGML